ncbi:hypothetical protein ACJX0J_012228, partial [Zea mays]
ASRALFCIIHSKGKVQIQMVTGSPQYQRRKNDAPIYHLPKYNCIVFGRDTSLNSNAVIINPIT